jgi:hypothetical protein
MQDLIVTLHVPYEVRKTECIKAIRAITRIGLKEAKDWVENWAGTDVTVTMTVEQFVELHTLAIGVFEVRKVTVTPDMPFTDWRL